MVKIWCEYDMGLPNTFGNYYTIFESKEKAIDALKKVDWSVIEYNSYQEVLDDGLLDIREI